MSTNLPSAIPLDSATKTLLSFNNYGSKPLEYVSTEIDACVGFFKNKGFDDDAALMVSSTLLKQAKNAHTPIYLILDSLSGYAGIQLSAVVGEILNNDRPSTSTLGFRTSIPVNNLMRNVSA